MPGGVRKHVYEIGTKMADLVNLRFYGRMIPFPLFLSPTKQ